MGPSSETGEPEPLRQETHSGRDAFTAGRDLTVNISRLEGDARRSGGRGILRPPLGRLPERVHGRDSLVDRLTALAEVPDGRAHVLAGLGGVGKSTVALAVAVAALAQDRLVWWVAGADSSIVASGLLGLALELGASSGVVEAARAGRTDACDVVWSRLEVHQGWVLVIDNADDLRVLEAADRRVADGNGWIRGSRSGLMLVTSRDNDPRHWERGAELHSLGWLSDEDGGSVLLDLAPRAGSRQEAQALSARLGGLALALHHAGSQLGSPFARGSFTAYLQAWHDRFPALPKPSGGVDDREMVTRTWELSLDQLTRAGVPQARALLEVLAWFAGAVPIPLDGLDYGVLGRVCAGRGAGEGLEALLSVGLLETRLVARDADSADSAGMDAILIHPLVAQTTRQRVNTAGLGRGASSVAVDVLAAATGHLDAKRPADWPTLTAWLPHLNELLAHAAPLLGASELITLADAAVQASIMLIWSGAYRSGVMVARDAQRDTKDLGPDHPTTLRLRFWQATGYAYLGNYAEAESLLRQVLKIEERILGFDHSDTLTTRHEIARMVAEQGNQVEAEAMFRQVLVTRERVVGIDHPSALTTRHAIARTVAAQGNTAKAEDLFRQLLQTEQRVLGLNHPSVLTTRHQVARTVADQGRFSEAEALFRQLLQTEERLVGADHADTLTTRHEIARMVAEQGNPAEAEALFRQVLEARERVLGIDHPSVLTTRHEIARMVAEHGNPA